MSYLFNPWSGLGNALEDANREWATALMPDFIAEVAAKVALAYSKDPGSPFEAVLERELYLAEPTFDLNEMHAAKFVIGKIFGENRRDRRNAERERSKAMDAIEFSWRE
jgi:hypothetical protein